VSIPVGSQILDSESRSSRRYLASAIAAQLTDQAAAVDWLPRIVDEDDFAAWKGGAALLDQLEQAARDRAKRIVRLGMVGSYTTGQLSDLLRLAAFRYGIFLEIYEAGFDQYRQEILDPRSGLNAFGPDVVLLAVHEGALELPHLSQTPESHVEAEADRWVSLWHRIRELSGAAVIQHNFVSRPDLVHGHLARTLPGSRASMVIAVNDALARRVHPGVAIVDAESLASRIGKDSWHDPRYWYLAKQAVSLQALPSLARHTGAVLAATMGLSRKVLVLDLDNTLWGGTVGDDGLENLVLGQGTADGEAFLDFQAYCKALADRGVVLAVCSKNDLETALLPFRDHPDMVLGEEDIAVFVANWIPKADNLRHIAEVLGLGLDSLVFVDDNPAERESIRRLVPEVEVVELSANPAEHVHSLASTPLFEPASLTEEDRQRTKQYRARAAAATIAAQASSLEEFHRELQMEAVVAPFDDLHLPRVVQLIMKTNQFNLTTRRHGDARVRAYMADPEMITMYVKLSDRLADHGLVAVVIGSISGHVLEIDTWVMSCRVIGRTLERTILAHLIETARGRELRMIRGIYVPTERNRMVSRLYPELGFEPEASGPDGTTSWTLVIPQTTPQNELIKEHAWIQ
jgi:FkbH-like protein